MKMMFYMLTENNGVNVTVGENQLLKYRSYVEVDSSCISAIPSMTDNGDTYIDCYSHLFSLVVK